jgi:hypothetical protein
MTNLITQILWHTDPLLGRDLGAENECTVAMQ